MDTWMDGWVDGWMDGWSKGKGMDGGNYLFIYYLFIYLFISDIYEWVEQGREGWRDLFLISIQGCVNKRMDRWIDGAREKGWMEGFILSFISDICRDGWIKVWIDGTREEDGWRDLFIHLFLTSMQGRVDKRMDRWMEQGRRMDGGIYSFIYF